MLDRSIEIYYDAKSIPGNATGDLNVALGFRNEAMHLIEAHLERAGAGEWSGAEVGANLETGEPEVNFGFTVEDFERAEAIVRDAVSGTRFDCIREIARIEIDLSDYM